MNFIRGGVFVNISDLSEYQLYKLKSIDPSLTPNWREVIYSILPDLDSESQNSLYLKILKPRGISLDANGRLKHRRPATLQETVGDIQSTHNGLLSVADDMFKIINSRSQYYDAVQLADEIEAIFGYLDNLNTRGLLYEQKNRNRIKIAFLYDLAYWIDTVELKISPGLRKLDSDMVKAYLKEVFIKQKVQDQDFRKWDSSDTDFQKFTYIPAFIRDEGEGRNFFVVEGLKYWFVIGSTDEVGKNPYSFRRFLHEDSSGNGVNEYIYLTHIVIKKYNMSDLKYLSDCSLWMSRFYTLDLGVPDTLLDFINEIRSLEKSYLKPLLKERLEQVGGTTEVIIKERMITYEKQASVLILQKLPRIQNILNSREDQDYLIYHLDKLIQEMIESMHDFRLQPLVMHSPSSDILLAKLMALRVLLKKSHDFIFSQELSIEERSEAMGDPLHKLQQELQDAKEFIKEAEQLESELDNYYEIKEKGSFWKKVALGRKPRYTLEEINKEKLNLKKEVFISIVRMAKNQKRGMVYIEFECDEIINKEYRHYALADGELGVTRLPRVLRLPEDKRKFDIDYIAQTVNQNIFEANQLW